MHCHNSDLLQQPEQELIS